MTTLTLLPSGVIDFTRPTGTPMMVTSEPSKMPMDCGKCAVTVRSPDPKGASQAANSRARTMTTATTLRRELENRSMAMSVQPRTVAWHELAGGHTGEVRDVGIEVRARTDDVDHDR